MQLFTLSNEDTSNSDNLQAWWQSVQQVAAYFFEIVPEPPVKSKLEALREIIDKLEATRTDVENLDVPFEAYHARSYLLAAITDLVTGFMRILSKEPSIGEAYIKASHIEMGFLEEELDELGIIH